MKLDVKLTDRFDVVAKAAERAQFRNLGHAANRIMKDAKASIATDQDPSTVGEPPHTKGKSGHNLRAAIRYDATKTDAVIGPMASYVDQAGAIHEFGQEFAGRDYPERPFMQPALEQNLDRFAADWKGSITE